MSDHDEATTEGFADRLAKAAQAMNAARVDHADTLRIEQEAKQRRVNAEFDYDDALADFTRHAGRGAR